MNVAKTQCWTVEILFHCRDLCFLLIPFTDHSFYLTSIPRFLDLLIAPRNDVSGSRWRQFQTYGTMSNTQPAYDFSSDGLKAEEDYSSLRESFKQSVLSQPGMIVPVVAEFLELGGEVY